MAGAGLLRTENLACTTAHPSWSASAGRAADQARPDQAGREAHDDRRDGSGRGPERDTQGELAASRTNLLRREAQHTDKMPICAATNARRARPQRSPILGESIVATRASALFFLRGGTRLFDPASFREAV